MQERRRVCSTCAAVTLGILLGMPETASAGEIYAITGAGSSSLTTSTLYTIDVGTGTVTTLGDTTVDHIVGIDFHPTTGMLYGLQSAGNNSSLGFPGQLYSIDPADGTAVAVGVPHGCSTPDISFAPDGTLYTWVETCGAGGLDELATVDLGNGSLSLFGASSVTPFATGVAFDNAGSLHVKGDDDFYAVDAGSGVGAFAFTLTGDCADAENTLAVDPVSGTFYTVERAGDTSYLCSVNTAAMTATRLHDIGVEGIAGLAFAPPTGGPLDVEVDLKPGSNPNCLNPKSRGRLPVAIYGSATFEISTIDQATLLFGGAAPAKCRFTHVEMEGPAGVFTTDSHADLLCHFPTPNVDLPAKGEDCGAVLLEGALHDATAILGGDLACLPAEPTCKAGIPIPLN